MDELKLNRIIDEELKMAPRISLSSDFSDRVTLKAAKHMQSKANLKEYFLFSASGLGLSALCLLFAYLMDHRLNANLIQKILDRSDYMLYLVVFALFSYFFDKVVLPFLFNLRR